MGSYLSSQDLEGEISERVIETKDKAFIESEEVINANQFTSEERESKNPTYQALFGSDRSSSSANVTQSSFFFFRQSLSSSSETREQSHQRLCLLENVLIRECSHQRAC